MNLREFRTQDRRLIMFKSHAGPQLDYCPIIFTRMLKAAQIAIRNVQREFARNTLGPSSGLNRRGRCELLNLEQLWLFRKKINRVFCFNPYRHNVYSATNVIHDASSPPYLLRSRYYSLKLTLTRLLIRAMFITVANCKL